MFKFEILQPHKYNMANLCVKYPITRGVPHVCPTSGYPVGLTPLNLTNIEEWYESELPTWGFNSDDDGLIIYYAMGLFTLWIDYMYDSGIPLILKYSAIYATMSMSIALKAFIPTHDHIYYSSFIDVIVVGTTLKELNCAERLLLDLCNWDTFSVLKRVLPPRYQLRDLQVFDTEQENDTSSIHCPHHLPHIPTKQ